MRTAGRVIPSLLLLGLLPAGANAGDDCPGNMKNATRVDIVIGETLTVDPSSVEVWLEEGAGKPGRVCWLVDGLQKGQTVHIQGKSDGDDHFPKAERTIRLPRTFANSGRPSKDGTFRYSVWVTEGDSDEPVLEVDPEVIIRRTGG